MISIRQREAANMDPRNITVNAFLFSLSTYMFILIPSWYFSSILVSFRNIQPCEFFYPGSLTIYQGYCYCQLLNWKINSDETFAGGKGFMGNTFPKKFLETNERWLILDWPTCILGKLDPREGRCYVYKSGEKVNEICLSLKSFFLDRSIMDLW